MPKRCCERTERLQPALDAAVAAGELGGYDVVTRLLPSARRSARGAHALPDDATLRARLAMRCSARRFAPMRSRRSCATSPRRARRRR